MSLTYGKPDNIFLQDKQIDDCRSPAQQVFNMNNATSDGRTIKITGVILMIYYIVLHSINADAYVDLVRYFKLNLFSVFFIINIVYLPVAVFMTFQNRAIGWVLVTIWLVFESAIGLMNLLSEIINPKQIYSHPDSWSHTTRGEIYLMAIIPFIFWIGLLWLSQRPGALTFYGIDPTRQKRLIVFTIIGACVFKLLVMSVSE